MELAGVEMERQFSRTIGDLSGRQRTRTILAQWVDYLNLLSMVQCKVMINRPDEELIRVITRERLNRTKPQKKRICKTGMYAIGRP